MTHARQRKTADERKSEILETAIRMGEQGNYLCITCDEIAARLGVAHSLITHHWGIAALREAVLEMGCARLIPRLVVEAVARNHPAASSLSAGDKARAINAIEG